jgi:hypothetical protein
LRARSSSFRFSAALRSASTLHNYEMNLEEKAHHATHSLYWQVIHHLYQSHASAAHAGAGK